MARKTDTFAFAIKGSDDLPEEMRARCETLVTEHREPQTAVFAPPLTHLPSSEQQDFADCAIAVYDEMLIVLRPKADALERIAIPFADVISVELGNILLYSWLKIVFGKHTSRDVKFPFNSVKTDLFNDIVDHVRNKLDTDLSGFLPKAITQDELPLNL